MIFAVLYKYLNCAVDKTIDTSHTISTDSNIYYRIILLIILFITLVPLKTDPSREIYTYATWVKSSFAKFTPW